MEKQLIHLLEKEKIVEAISRFFNAVDDKQLNAGIIRATFTDDAVIIKPNGMISTGRENILEDYLKSFARFKSTHHITSDHIINFKDQNAVIRLNLTAMHMWGDDHENKSLHGKYFHAGGVLNANAQKTEGAWKINKWMFNVVWRSGEGLQEMVKMVGKDN